MLKAAPQKPGPTVPAMNQFAMETPTVQVAVMTAAMTIVLQAVNAARKVKKATNQHLTKASCRYSPTALSAPGTRKQHYTAEKVRETSLFTLRDVPTKKRSERKQPNDRKKVAAATLI